MDLGGRVTSGLGVALLALCATVQAGPKLVCNEPIHNFGELENTQVVEHTFVIHNTGDEPLDITRVSPACGCTVTDIVRKVVPPGGKTGLTIKLSLKGLSGKQRKGIWVKSNDAENSAIRLHLEGKAIPLVEVLPSAVLMGCVDEDVVMERIVEIIIGRGISLGVTDTKCNSAQFSARLETVTEGRRYRLHVRTVPPLPKGRLYGKVKLATDRKDYPMIEVPISASVADELSISPAEIIVSADGNKLQTRYVFVGPGKTKKFSLQSVEAPLPLIRTEIEQIGALGYRIALHEIPVVEAMGGKKLRISTDVPGMKEIELPFRYARRTIRIGGRAKDITDEGVLVEYFYEAGCKECYEISTQVLPELKNKYRGFYVLRKFDTAAKRHYLRLVEYQDEHEIARNEPVSMVVDATYFLSGINEIRKSLIKRVGQAMMGKVGHGRGEGVSGAGDKGSSISLKERTRRFTLPAVALAGLADGINPCAIATLVFFVSLLVVSKAGRSRMLLFGGAFCLASFITYTAIGFGLLRALYTFSGFGLVQRIVDIAMSCVLAVFAALSFRDAYRFRANRNPTEITLQLPSSIKELIHRILHGQSGMKTTAAGAFVAGSAVTALESVCTGQLYVPTLVFVIKSGDAALRGWAYLLVYNGMFILPLVVVLVLTYRGLRMQQLIEWSVRNVVRSKILLGSLFAALAVIIILL